MSLLTSSSTVAESLPAHERLEQLRTHVPRLIAALREALGVECFLFDGHDGALLHESKTQPAADLPLRGELSRAVANRPEPAFLADEEPLLVFALPLSIEKGETLVAVAAFATRPLQPQENVGSVAQLLGLSEQQTVEWFSEQEYWTARQLTALGKSLIKNFAAERDSNRLRDEVEKVSDNLASTYEEISVLYAVTQNLRLSSSDEDLGRLALNLLCEVIPAEGLAIEYLPTTTADRSGKGRHAASLLTAGTCPVKLDEFTRLVDTVGFDVKGGPVVVNDRVTSKGNWKFPQINQLIAVPLAQADNLFGWMAAFNHTAGGEFGTVEASLMSSVAAILGIHSGNLDLYRQQSDFLAQMVRALTSAIDAKDPYTCGHSDRVARLSVRLGHHLGCDTATLNKLYMGGLLHDIGKIGIDDHVLRKPGRLTQAEFEHIKLHPELGYKILCDVKQLGDVLPIVLHHHESWDGSGYPHGLAGEEIPFLARICAVADAFDAMSSDRPYRKGMPEEQVDEIFRKGAGQQWDAEVVAAFFATRGDIREISREERADLALDVQLWI